MKVRLGYSFWGFLGSGIIDTSDGGRSHRMVLVKALLDSGADLVMLQKNRDLVEAGDDFRNDRLCFDSGFPELDALFVEYRWRIPGRNCLVEKDDIRYTPDFDRQSQLLSHYTRKRVPIMIWDKDQKMDERIEIGNRAYLFEASLLPRSGYEQLLFPVDYWRVRLAYDQIGAYTKKGRDKRLVYVGNQYERDESFKKYIDYPAALMSLPVPVFGNWTKYSDKFRKNLRDFPNVAFKGRIHYDSIIDVYKSAMTTCLIAPDRYYKNGQFTQRLFECLWGLCIPLVPREYNEAEKVVIKEWVVRDGRDVVDKVRTLDRSSDDEIKGQLRRQFGLLSIFNASRQAAVIMNTVRSYYKHADRSN